MTREQKFYKALQDVFIGTRIEGTGSFVNLMRIKSNYYRKTEEVLKQDIEKYIFLKDEGILKIAKLNYKGNRVKVYLSKLYPNIDIAETLSNLTGKRIKKVSEGEVEFEDRTKINTKDLDY